MPRPIPRLGREIPRGAIAPLSVLFWRCRRPQETRRELRVHPQWDARLLCCRFERRLRLWAGTSVDLPAERLEQRHRPRTMCFRSLSMNVHCLGITEDVDDRQLVARSQELEVYEGPRPFRLDPRRHLGRQLLVRARVRLHQSDGRATRVAKRYAGPSGHPRSRRPASPALPRPSPHLRDVAAGGGSGAARGLSRARSCRHWDDREHLRPLDGRHGRAHSRTHERNSRSLRGTTRGTGSRTRPRNRQSGELLRAQ